MKKRLNLCQGELICPDCDGIGAIKSVDNSYPNTVNFSMICPKCKGTGKLDWLEVITGKKGNWIPF